MADRPLVGAPQPAPDDRPAVYREGTSWIYRASSFGNCPKELTAIRCGHTPAPFPQRFDKIFADGHRGEDVIIAELESRGYKVTDRQRQINWQIPGTNCVIRGHIDGIIEDSAGNRSIFDAKTTSAKYGIAKNLHAKYELQLSIYGHALGLETAVLGVGVKDPETGDVESVTIQAFDSLPVSRAEIIAKMHQLDGYAKHYDDVGDFPYCDEKQYPCGVYQLHHGKGGDDGDPYGGFFENRVEDNSLDTFAAMYLEAAQAEAAAKEAKANARKMILQHVGGEENRTTGDYAIKFTGTGIKKELDKARLERYLASLGPGAPKIEDFMGTKTVSKSIRVEPIGAEK